jgi:hypothetical protein
VYEIIEEVLNDEQTKASKCADKIKRQTMVYQWYMLVKNTYGSFSFLWINGVYVGEEHKECCKNKTTKQPNLLNKTDSLQTLA